MVKGRTEKEYRQLDLNSSSSLKEFSLDRKKYYKKYVLSEEEEEKLSQAAIMGQLVETLLLEPEEFDERFYMSGIMNAPTGLMLEFVEALYKLTKEATDENGNITKSFEDISREAYALSGFKIKYEAVINKFVGSDAEIFYDEMRKVRSKGLTVVVAADVNMAEKIVENLKTNDVTHEIVNIVNSSRYEVFHQLQIEEFEIEGLKMKAMLDKVVVDHQTKTIQAYDLKCVWAVENFYDEYYLYRRAYIQAYVYFEACKAFSETFEGEYTILPIRFIVCDSGNYYNPLIYTLNGEDLLDAYSGFSHNGRKYPGVKKIISDLKWAIENDKWDIGKDNYYKKGVLNIKEGK